MIEARRIIRFKKGVCIKDVTGEITKDVGGKLGYIEGYNNGYKTNHHYDWEVTTSSNDIIHVYDEKFKVIVDSFLRWQKIHSLYYALSEAITGGGVYFEMSYPEGGLDCVIDVQRCSLCDFYFYNEEEEGLCNNCPVTLYGKKCGETGSLWDAMREHAMKTVDHAERVIGTLKKMIDDYIEEDYKNWLSKN